MRVKFLVDSSYPQNDPARSRDYRAGQEYELDDDHARRWIRRQKAVEVPVRKVEAKAAKETGPVPPKSDK